MKLLVLSGGRHPYHETTPILDDFLKDAGHEVHVTEDAGVLTSDSVDEYDVLVFNTRREEEMTLAENEQVAMTRFIGSGKGFVCIHISNCGPKSWPEYHDVCGGGWISGSSAHPPYGQFTVNVKNASHPCAEGITDFITNDELYAKLALKSGNDVFLTGEIKGGEYPMGHIDPGTYPLGWTRRYGNGKVFNTALGHNGLSVQTPQFQRLILNGVKWVTSKEV